MLLVATDCAAVTIGLATAYWLRFSAQWLGLETRKPTLPAFALAALVPLWIAAFAVAGLYKRNNLVSGLREYRNVLGASATVVLGMVTLTYLVQVVAVSRGLVLLTLGGVTVAVWLSRFSVRRLIYVAGVRGRPLDRVLIVGANTQAVAIATLLNRSRSAASRVVGYLSEYVAVGQVVGDGIRVLGDPFQLHQVAKEVGATRAVIVESGLSWESLQDVVRHMHRRNSIEICLIPGLFDLHATPMSAVQLGPVLALSPQPSRIVGLEAGLKRALDVTAGAAALTLALPLMVGMMLASALGGNGLGIKNETFLAQGRELKLARFVHPSWARKHHLSRLPELFSVISGGISLVGPRPISARRVDEYGRASSLVEAVRPGFVGPWWLVSLTRPPDIQGELAYDLFYIRTYSIWSDFQILIHVARYLLMPSSRRPEGPSAREGRVDANISRLADAAPVTPERRG
jgi:lipopolysaccharide/colanic/teichoic acid biosynthesis glycosyltransferase